MKKIIPILALLVITTASAQMSAKSAKQPAVEADLPKAIISTPAPVVKSFSEEEIMPALRFKTQLTIIMLSSHSDFKEHRFDEYKQSADFIRFDTDLLLPGFLKANVFIGEYNPYYKDKSSIQSSLYARRVFTGATHADFFLKTLTGRIRSSVKVTKMDSLITSKTQKHYVFLIRETDKPGVIIEVDYDKEDTGVSISINISSEAGSRAEGGKTASSLQKPTARFTNVTDFIEALLQAAATNFTIVENEYLPITSSKYPRFSTILSFNGAERTYVDYVKWSETYVYSSHKEYKQGEAEAPYKELADEVERVLASQFKHLTINKTSDFIFGREWELQHNGKDNDGNAFKCKLELRWGTHTFINNAHQVMINFKKEKL